MTADKNRYPGTLRPSETSVREDFEATVAAAIARKNRYPEEQEAMKDPRCGAGHICCDDPSRPPLHDHFLEPSICPRCIAVLCDDPALTPPVICEGCDNDDHGHCEERWASWCDCECNHLKWAKS